MRHHSGETRARVGDSCCRRLVIYRPSIDAWETTSYRVGASTAAARTPHHLPDTSVFGSLGAPGSCLIERIRILHSLPLDRRAQRNDSCDPCGPHRAVLPATTRRGCGRGHWQTCSTWYVPLPMTIIVNNLCLATLASKVTSAWSARLLSSSPPSAEQPFVRGAGR
jgi:hypothetical protein